MSDYFRKFPLLSYGNVEVRDITRRIKLSIKALNDPMIYLPYTIGENEKPEDIAYYYYGSVDYTWLVLLSNDILDPYYDWPMTSEQFTRYFIDKYQELSGETSYDVIAWAQSQSNPENIVFYYKEENGVTLKKAPESTDISGWSVMRLYDYEQLLNEEKRNIQLVDNIYKDRIDSEYRKLILK